MYEKAEKQLVGCVDESLVDVHKPRITTFHFINHPFFALLVANVGFPCWQRNTDGLSRKKWSVLHKGDILTAFTHVWRVWWDGIANGLVERQQNARHLGKDCEV